MRLVTSKKLPLVLKNNLRFIASPGIVRLTRGKGKVMLKLKTLDLFSGVGGFSLGLEKTGYYETIMFCENDLYKRQILRKHWPNIHIEPDICELNVCELDNIDVICGGFPCTNISTASFSHYKRTGLDGEFSGLWWQYLRIINDAKPKFVIIENVKDLARDGLRNLLRSLATIGYNAEWDCLSAASFGLLQQRSRLVIVAYPSEIGNAGLFKIIRSGKIGQGWQGSQEDLQQIYRNPFESGNCYPQPLLCGMDVRVPNRVDRIGAMGDCIIPDKALLIGNAIAYYLMQK